MHSRRAHLSCLAAGRDARGGAQVRSPAEYLKGHIPGAVSLPLFDNDECAAVGTTFTKVGRYEAIREGCSSLCGFDVCTLEGGYRSYRRWCKTVVGQKELPAPAPVVVLGGCTGVGKTAVLHELCAAGEQFLDLEVRPPADPRCRAPHYKLHSHR